MDGVDDILRDGGGAATSVALLDDEAVRSLSDLVGDDPELIAELVDAFLDEAPVRLDELRTGVAQGDLVLAGRAAHTLKSNGFTFGARTLGELCQELETAAQNGHLDEASPLVARVETEWSRVRPALDALRSGTPS